MIKKNILLNEFLSINFTISTDYETFKSMLFSSLKSLKEIEIKTFTVIKSPFLTDCLQRYGIKINCQVGVYYSTTKMKRRNSN